jgi:3-methyl-2-oxobutanoate hydroxymethyltransferase
MGITAATLRSMKVKGTKFAGLVLYDACFARLAREAGIEVSVVGDSVGMSVLGHPTTVATTMDDMVYHTRAAAMGHGDGLLIGDLPFMSYATLDMAVRNAALLMQAGAHMVKLEGGGTWATETVAFLVQRGIPVCGHIGLTPQSFHKLGGHRVQGKVPEEATRLLAESRALQDAGAELLVLECVPRDLAAEITKNLDIPVMGAGAGIHCDGQVLLAYDVLGLTGSKLRFAKDYLKNGACGSLAAFRQFAEEVRAGQFPGDEHSFGLEGAKLA